MKQFTLIEQDRYIKIDGTGIFFTPEDWPFVDIEHLWAIQWKDNGTDDGEGWVEYDSAIPNTPIAKCQIEKYVNHHTTELNKQIDSLNEKNMKLLAEFDNFQRRTIDEKVSCYFFNNFSDACPHGSRNRRRFYTPHIRRSEVDSAREWNIFRTLRRGP